MLSLRPIEAEELVVVSRLAHAIWPVAYAGILTPEQIGNMLEKIYAPAALADECTRGHRFFLAQADDQPAGFVSGFRENGTIWIKKLYVDVQRQGQGIGKRLMETLVQHFSPANSIKLLVNRENLPAQRVYERFGFVREKEVSVQMGDFAFVDFQYAKVLP